MRFNLSWMTYVVYAVVWVFLIGPLTVKKET